MDFSALTSWLDAFKTWISDTVKGLFADGINLIFDLFIWLVDKLFWLVSMVFSFIPAPDLGAVSMVALFNQLPSIALWLIIKLKVVEALSLVVSAVVFKILRRLFTLGIW